MSNKIEHVYIDCFYYGFYIKKTELEKYNIKPEQLVEYSKNKIKKQEKVNIKPTIKNCDNVLHNVYKQLKISNCSNTLNSNKVLEQLKSCNFKFIFYLLTIRSIIKTHHLNMF